MRDRMRRLVGYISGRASTCVVVILLASIPVGCDTMSGGGSVGEVVIESFLVSGQAPGRVRVSRTESIETVYDFNRLAISDARVTLRLLDDQGRVESAWDYSRVPGSPGIYVALGGEPVLPLRSYELEVETSQGELVSSRTVVPGTFEILETSASTVTYQAAEQFSIRVTRSAYPGRQSIFVFSTESLDARIDNMTPLYFEIVDGDEDEVEDFRVNESPTLNEANYTANADGSLTVRLPWLAVAFYGPHVIRANAVDDNLFDFLRTQSIQQGAPTLSPGEIPNIIDHVDGGTGIFGSISRVSAEVFIQR